MLCIQPCGAGEAGTKEAAARQPPDLVENKTAANDTQADILPWLITKLLDGEGRVLREAVALSAFTHHFARQVFFETTYRYPNYGKC